VYNEFGSFQFGVPVSWESFIEDGVFISKNPVTGSYYTVGVEAATLSLEEITKEDYQKAYGNVEDYSISAFNHTGNSISIVATYNDNGSPVVMQHNIVQQDGFLYEFSFYSSQESYDADIIQYHKATSIFTTF